MTTREVLVAKQAEAVAKLEAELAAFIEAGNELYAKYTRDDIIVASSLARLVHPAPRPCG